jgi:cell division protein FtsW (lipid II flippase)
MSTTLARLDRRALLVGVLALAAVGLLLLAPDALAAAGNDVGHNAGNWLKQNAAELWGGIVAIVAIVFLINRRYTELGIFICAAVAVAVLVFSPGSVAHFARDTAHTIFG